MQPNNNWECVGRFATIEEAQELEALLHEQGVSAQIISDDGEAVMARR